MNFKTWEHTVEIWNETIKMARWEIVMPPEYVKGYKAGKKRGKKEEHNRAVEYIKRLRAQIKPHTAQFEIIRCKYCKWFGDIGCAIRIVDDSDRPSENDFCSFAERKDNE